MTRADLYRLIATESSLTVAPVLLGCVMHTEVDGATVALRITEVEAYGGADDPASHARNGRTPRNGTMFQRGGHLYVYRSYGIHWCANVVTGVEGDAQAVLLRAGNVIEGQETAAARRGRPSPLAAGPGMLTQALGISGDHDGHMLSQEPVQLTPGPSLKYETTPRIGITRAVERPWRFVAVAD